MKKTQNRKQVVRLTEGQLRHMIKEALDGFGDESSNFCSWMATLADGMRELRYNKEADMLERFLDSIGQHPEKMRTANPQITRMLKDVLADAERKYANGGNEWDDFDDFINLLKEVIESYGHQVFAAMKKYPVQNDFDDMGLNEARKRKNMVRVNETQLKRIVKESVKRILKEYNNDLDDMSNDGEYPYYVAADWESDYFKTFKEAYNYALRLARKEKDWFEDILLMDNERWQTIMRFTEDGIDDFQNGTHEQYPW